MNRSNFQSITYLSLKEFTNLGYSESDKRLPQTYSLPRVKFVIIHYLLRRNRKGTTNELYNSSRVLLSTPKEYRKTHT